MKRIVNTFLVVTLLCCLAGGVSARKLHMKPLPAAAAHVDPKLLQRFRGLGGSIYDRDVVVQKLRVSHYSLEIRAEQGKTGNLNQYRVLTLRGVPHSGSTVKLAQLNFVGQPSRLKPPKYVDNSKTIEAWFLLKDLDRVCKQIDAASFSIFVLILQPSKNIHLLDLQVHVPPNK